MSKAVDVESQVRIYVDYERPRYESFAIIIEWLLKEIRQRVAPLATVGVRPKEVASFAEKILRKAKYDDPVHQFADLCGGRLVVHTRMEKAAAEEMLVRCFKVFAREDKETVAEVNQFGYGSLHLDVCIGADFQETMRSMGIEMPDGISRAVRHVLEPRHDGGAIERKAEIQVRTDLQHVWADTLHDLLYKGGINMPKALQREANRLAAVLEEASNAIDGLVGKLSSYKVDHGAFLSVAELTGEKKRLVRLQGQKLSDKAHGEIALRLAKMARGIRDWRQAIAQEPWVEKMRGPKRDELRFVIAEARCRNSQDNPGSAEFSQGFADLEILAKPVTIQDEGLGEEDKLGEIANRVNSDQGSVSEKAFRATAMAELARARFLMRDGLNPAREARDLYFQAHLLEPGNPYVFCRYLHAQTIAQESRSSSVFMRAGIDQAIGVCRSHEQVGIELPFAHFTEAMFHAILGDLDSCLLSCIRGVATSNDPGLIREEITLFEELRTSLRGKNPQFAKQLLLVLRTLNLGLDVKTPLAATPDNGETKPVPKRESKYKALDTRIRGPVVIVAGTCDPKYHDGMVGYDALIAHALRGFSGTVYCGGSTVGVSAMVGDAVMATKAKNPGIALKAHWPGTLNSRDEKHPGYEFLPMPEAEGFTYAQPIQYWCDLLAAGIKPESVRVLGIGGGKIALFEYYLAFALGAKVGLLQGSGRSAARFAEGESWWSKAKTGRAVSLPKDKETLWNFLNVNPENLGLTEESIRKIEPAAKGLHESYRSKNLEAGVNKSLAPWESLDASLKISNYHQALHASKILGEADLEILPLALGAGEPVRDLVALLKSDGIDRLAEMEHGRWNVERLLEGWKWGPTKDIKERLNPCIVPWEQLEDGENGYKKYDRDLFINLPGVLEKSGLGIFKRAQSSAIPPENLNTALHGG